MKRRNVRQIPDSVPHHLRPVGETPQISIELVHESRADHFERVGYDLGSGPRRPRRVEERRDVVRGHRHIRGELQLVPLHCSRVYELLYLRFIQRWDQWQSILAGYLGDEGRIRDKDLPTTLLQEFKNDRGVGKEGAEELWGVSQR